MNELVEWAGRIKHAEIYDGCQTDILDKTIALLKESGHAWNNELSSFYLLTNGYYYNGIYVFPVKSADNEQYNEILGQNIQWDIARRLPGCLMFGRSDEEVYVFNQPNNNYQILDFTGWDEYYCFDSLTELLQFVISERL